MNFEIWPWVTSSLKFDPKPNFLLKLCLGHTNHFELSFVNIQNHPYLRTQKKNPIFYDETSQAKIQKNWMFLENLSSI